MRRILLIAILLGVVFFPHATGTCIAIGAALYLVLLAEDAVKRNYHAWKTDTATSLTARYHVCLLIRYSHHQLARRCYERLTEVEDVDDPSLDNDALGRLAVIAILVMIGGAVLADGISTFTAPWVSNIFALIALALLSGVGIGIGHILWFEIARYRTSTESLILLENNLEIVLGK